MQDMNSKETLKFKYNRWLSRKQDDGEIMRELPAIRPSQQVLPGMLLTYTTTMLPYTTVCTCVYHLCLPLKLLTQYMCLSHPCIINNKLATLVHTYFRISYAMNMFLRTRHIFVM